MKKLIPFLTVLVLLPMVIAQFPLTQYTNLLCSSNNTLRIENFEDRCIDGICKNFSVTKETYCQFGCVQDNVIPQCAPSPWDISIYYVIPIFGGFIIIIIIMLKRLS